MQLSKAAEIHGIRRIRAIHGTPEAADFAGVLPTTSMPFQKPIHAIV
ncbi:MAG TPA: hypothetical protein PK992_12985 [Planctomycetaceae bacterium]|nr:hypothetical protein [Planctomycetaceae bacterium]